LSSGSYSTNWATDGQVLLLLLRLLLLGLLFFFFCSNKNKRLKQFEAQFSQSKVGAITPRGSLGEMCRIIK
jgi:hypothetical protein